MTATRLFILSAAAAVGVLTTDVVRASLPVALTLVVLSWAAALGWRRSIALLVLAAVCTGYARADLRMLLLERAVLARGAHRSADALLEGTIRGDPVRDATSVRFRLDVARAEVDGAPYRVRERAWITVRPAVLVRGGDVVRVDAVLRPLERRDADRAMRASARRLRDRGIAARAFSTPDRIEVTGRSRAVLDVVAERGRAGVRRAAAYLPERERGLLLGVTIGDTSSLDPIASEEFRIAGLSHIVAVSGANVAFVLAGVALVLRAVRARLRATAVTLGATVLAFMAVARFEPSVVRAGVMAIIALVGTLLGARRHATTTLAGSCLVLVLADPFIVRAPGFLLSVAATAGILVLAPRIAERLPPGNLAAAAAVGLGAQLAVAPLIVLLFGNISLISIAANLVAAPMVAPATVLGFVAAVGGALWAPLGAVSVLAYPALVWMLWSAHVLSALPLAAISIPRGPIAVAVVLGTIAVIARTLRRARPRARRPFAVALVIALTATGGVWARALSPAGGGLEITMIDVGQGDAFLVREGGRVMVVDGGPDERKLAAALAMRGVRRIDLLVMTHPHADHIDGLVAAVRALPVARALDPEIESPLRSYGSLVRALAQRGAPRDRASTGARYRLGSSEVDVLWPPPDRMEATESDVNNNSIVFVLRYGRQRVLFAGETQEEAQDGLLEHHRDALVADVVKVSHHGSARMRPEFYAASRARVALIPVGTNTFGHPAPATLEALRGMRIVRSDHHGDVVVRLDGGTGVTIRTEG